MMVKILLSQVALDLVIERDCRILRSLEVEIFKLIRQLHSLAWLSFLDQTWRRLLT